MERAGGNDARATAAAVCPRHREAAAKLGVSNHRIRRLIKDRVLEAEQVVPGAPYQIRACDLQDEQVIAAIGRTGRPCPVDPANQLAMFSDT
jgi:excisionase family DNA binding protein